MSPISRGFHPLAGSGTRLPSGSRYLPVADAIPNNGLVAAQLLARGGAVWDYGETQVSAPRLVWAPVG